MQRISCPINWKPSAQKIINAILWGNSEGKIDWNRIDTETKAEEEREAVENDYDAFKENHDCHLEPSGEGHCDNPVHKEE